MKVPVRVFTISFAVFALLGAGTYLKKAQAQGPSQNPILDMVAGKVIQKYQTSTCEQLWVERSKKAPPSAEEQKVIGFLKNDPQMRTIFINKVAPPIANKMFDCGMIP
jgi:hypothetical protein